MSAKLLSREVEQAMARALSRSDVEPQLAPSVVQNLTFEGFTLVPVTIIGASGWTPEQLWAYQAGIMHERFERGSKVAVEG